MADLLHTTTATFIIFLAFLPISFCRHYVHHTTTLNVAAAISKTRAVLSSTPVSAAGLETNTVSLHSRESISAVLHQDYRSLTLARIERDEARVKAINARLNLAVGGVKKADLVPLVLSDELEGPIVSGVSQGSGEYFSRVGVGKPAKPMYMVLDTGSDVTWVQCQPCSDCYTQADPIYDPAASATYSAMACDAAPCKALDVSACRNGSCLYQVSYGDGSYTVGDFVTETVTFGDSAAGAVRIAIGCGHDNEGLFVGSAGLLGLGGGALSFPSQIKAESFSYCLVDRDSSASSTLDFGDAAAISADAVTAPLLKNSKLATFYYVGMAGISVGGQMLSIPPATFEMDESGNGGVIVDSGTAVTRLQTAAYNALRDAFVAGTKSLAKADGVALFDTCYNLSNQRTVTVPTVSLHFGDSKTLRLPAKNYLIPVDSSGTFCFAFAPTTTSLSIVGNLQQQGTRVSFDLANSVVGFTSNKC